MAETIIEAKNIAKVREYTKWIINTLNRAKQSNLKIIPNFGELAIKKNPEEDITNTLDLLECLALGYATHPQTGGWQMTDEPPIKLFPNLNVIKNTIIEGENDALKETGVESHHVTMVNLYGFGSPESGVGENAKSLPNNANKNNSKSTSYHDDGIYRYFINHNSDNYSSVYDNYLNKFQLEFAPGVWCSDVYAFSNKGDYKTGDVTRIDFNGGFIKNVKVMADNAKRAGRPFWNIVRTKAYYNSPDESNEKIEYENRWFLTEDMIRIEAFISLLFGAQGLYYWSSFTIGPETDNPNHPEEYRVTPVMINPIDDKTCEVERTHLFYYLKRVNNLIERYNEVFLGCDVKDVRYAGEYFKGVVEDVNETLSIGAATIEIPMVEEKQGDKTVIVNKNKPGFLISYIQNGETTMPGVPYDYIAIMNLDMQYEHELKLKFNKLAVDLSDPNDILDAEPGYIKIRPASVRIFKIIGL